MNFGYIFLVEYFLYVLLFIYCRIIQKYNCGDDTWMMRTYSCREKWCPAFSKDYFSCGIIASQRSESMNGVLTERLHKTVDLCEFYHIFCDILKKWRDEEQVENFNCINGRPDVIVPNMKLLYQMREVYTTKIYNRFEREFLKGMSFFYKVVGVPGAVVSYELWCKDDDLIRHVVQFSTSDQSISCTCKMFSEVGFLCCHCLRILNIHCVDSLPEQYINARWKRDLCVDRTTTYEVVSIGSRSSTWRLQTMRTFNRLVSKYDCKAGWKEVCDEAIRDLVLKSKEFDVGEGDVGMPCSSSQGDVIKDPKGSRAKGGKNRRMKSTVEKKGNQLKAREKRAAAAKEKAKKASQAQVQEMMLEGFLTLSHPADGGSSLQYRNCD